MSKIVFSWGGEVHVGKWKPQGSVGTWRETYKAGKTLFCGRMHTSTDWSPWMTKRELRDWFAARANVDEVQG